MQMELTDKLWHFSLYLTTSMDLLGQVLVDSTSTSMAMPSFMLPSRSIQPPTGAATKIGGKEGHSLANLRPMFIKGLLQGISQDL